MQKIIKEAQLVFTDGSSNGKAAMVINGKSQVLQTSETSAQKAELIAVIHVFAELSQETFNLFSDSQYVVRLFPHIETAILPEQKPSIFDLLIRLQKQIWSQSLPYYVGHIRAHSNLPGGLFAGNNQADLLTKTIIGSNLEEAKQSHSLHHQNSAALRYQFHIPREISKTIVKNCKQCPSTQSILPMGVNPRGLSPNKLWQMDVTHVPSFGKLSFVHVTVDTYSHVIIASARTGEAFKDVVQHLFYCFSYLGNPQALKTDNAPAYTSKAFKDFCAAFKLSHSTGIPYNPQGQAIVERVYHTLKIQITKLQQGEFKHTSPHHILHHAMFVLNNLNTDNLLNNLNTRKYSNAKTLES